LNLRRLIDHIEQDILGDHAKTPHRTQSGCKSVKTQHRHHEQDAKNTNSCGPSRVHRLWRLSLSKGERFLPPDPNSWGSYIGNFRSGPRNNAHGTGKRRPTKNCWKQLRATNLIFCFSIPTGNHSTERSHIRPKNRYCENTILGFIRRNSLAVLKPHTTQGAWPSRRKCALAIPLGPLNFCLPIRKTGNKSPTVTM